jgi:hypothetical protein
MPGCPALRRGAARGFRALSSSRHGSLVGLGTFQQALDLGPQVVPGHLLGLGLFAQRGRITDGGEVEA